jgi:hypothetical protein
MMGERTHRSVSSLPGRADALVSVSSEASTLVDGLVMDVTRALFDHYGVKLELDGSPVLKTLSTVQLISTIGFSSPTLDGSLLLAIPNVVIQQMLPTPDASLADWTGELANQLCGRLKNKLLNYDVVINLALPVVVSGDDLNLPVQAGLLTRHFSFVCDGGRLFVRTEMALCASVELVRQSLASESAGMDEGALLFF